MKPILREEWDSGKAVYAAPMSPKTMDKSTDERVNFLDDMMQEDDLKR